MFNLEQPANPLELLASHLGTGLVKQQLQKREDKQVSDILSKIGPDSSPFDAINAIEGARISPEKKAELHKVYQNAYELKTKRGEKQPDSTGIEADAKLVGISPEEFAKYSPDTRKKLVTKATRPPSKEGVTSQPVPPEVGQAIESVLGSNPDATSDQLLVQMDKAGVPRIYSNALIENRRRDQERGNAREDILEAEQAKGDIAYQKQIPEMQKTLAHRKDVTNRFEDLNKKGVTGKPYEKFLEKVGLINLTSEGRREAGSLQKEYTKDIRQILGSQFSAQEFFTILNSYPSPDFSKEANQAIINNYKIWDDIKEKEIAIANKLIKENKGRPPRNFELDVANSLSEYANSRVPEMRKNIEKVKSQLETKVPSGFVLMYDQNGDVLHVPANELDQAINLGATRP
jgi:hypothetical protein